MDEMRFYYYAKPDEPPIEIEYEKHDGDYLSFMISVKVHKTGERLIFKYSDYLDITQEKAE